MPRGKDAPADVGGQIDPYVQRSMQQGRQLAESRLVASMQEAGATRRAAKQESGATMRQGMQMGMQAVTERQRQAAQMAQEDKRAAEAERARRDDREFTKTMTGINNKLRAKEAELDRQMERAMHEENIDLKRETAGRQLAFDKVRATLGERAQIRQTNLIVSLTKGIRKSAENDEKIKTTMYEQADQFDQDKGKYEEAKKSLGDSIENDKRMDLPARKPRSAFRGAGTGMTYALPEETKENLADPMGVLQDLIIKREGKISVEDLSSANIHKIDEQMANEDVQTEDINEVFGALDAMLEKIDEKRTSVDKKSREFDFWNDQHIAMSQFKRNLVGLEDSKTKIKGSETETVGKRILYALRTIRRGSLGNRVSRAKAAGGDAGVETFFEEEISGPSEPYELLEITPEMNEWDIEARDFVNTDILPLYMKSQQQTEVDWGAD